MNTNPNRDGKRAELQLQLQKTSTLMQAMFLSLNEIIANSDGFLSEDEATVLAGVALKIADASGFAVAMADKLKPTAGLN